MLLLLSQVAAGAGLAAAGFTLIRWSRPIGTASGALALGLILLKAVAGHIPAAEPTLFPWDWYPLVEPSWYLLPAMFLLGAGLEIAGRSPGRREALIAAAILILGRTARAAWVTTRPPELKGTVSDAGVCLQTSSYSCGAAAAASFLYYYGIRSTEQEMGTLCCTRSGGLGLAGTSDAGLIRGLRRKLDGRLSIQIARQRYEELSTPALVPIQVYPGVGHCILLWRVDPELVHVLDPRCGRVTMSRADFEELWTGTAIWAE
jgi:predicted double-glycine peptidase